MCDRRIAIYQIYHRLTNDTKLIPIIANNMINHGFVSLANYIYKLPRTHQLVQSVISTEFLATSNSQGNTEEGKTKRTVTNMRFIMYIEKPRILSLMKKEGTFT